MRPFEVRTETIAVAGGRDVTLAVRSTVHGPVIDDVVKPLAPVDADGGALGDPGYVLTLRWTALVGAESNLDTFLRLDRAASYADFRAAVSDFGGPAQNFVYADDAGHIAWQLGGRVPIRAGGHDGSVPVAGWDGAAEWTGYVPFEDLPRLLDPQAGAVVTANNAPTGADYPYFLGREWDAGYRAARISELLGQKNRLSPTDVQAIQLDDRLLRSVPLIAAVAEADPGTADGRLVCGRVTRWDGAAAVDSPGAAAAEVLAYRLLRDVFDDELGGGPEKDALARQFVGSQQARSVLARLLTEAKAGEPAERWWDDVTTPGVVEAPTDTLGRACDEAGAALRAALGGPDGWTWGRLHRMVYREPTLGSSGIPPFELIFDRGPVPVGGSFDAVLNTVWIPSVAYPDPYDPDVRPGDLLRIFETVVAPSYRGVYDAGDWDASRIVSTTGQSGHPLDRHFADLIDPWLEGELLPFPFSDSAVMAATTETLTLAP
jgi:penicillin amidase